MFCGPLKRKYSWFSFQTFKSYEHYEVECSVFSFAIRHKNETNGHLLELTRVVKHMNEIGVEMIKWEFGSICLL